MKKRLFFLKKNPPRITDCDPVGDFLAWKLHCDGWGLGVAPTAREDPTDTKDINTILLSLKKMAADAKSGSSAGNASNPNAANGSPEAAGKK